MTRRALVVAYCFPPHAAIGTHRALRLVTHLAGRGWEIDVLTARPEAYLPGTAVDEGLLDRVPAGVRVTRTGAFRGLTRLGRALEPLKRTLRPAADRPTGTTAARVADGGGRADRGAIAVAKALVEELCAMPDKDVGWVAPAIARGLRASAGRRPDVIFSSAPPWSTHIVAAALARRLGSRWVADFRDPWVRSPWTRYTTGPAKGVATWLERLVVTTADAVLFTTEAARQEFAGHYGPAMAGRFHAVPNGCDPADFDGIESGPATDQLVLLHAGTLYGGRSPLPLLRAVAAVAAADPRAAARLRVRFLGSTTFPGLDIPRVCADLGIAGLVDLVPRVERRESLAEMRRASALVILQGGTSMAIPGKLYEYLAAGRPILALCEDGEMGALIREQGAGLVVPPENDAAIRDALLTLLATPEARWPRAAPASYDGRVRAAEMAAVIESVCAGEAGSHAPSTGPASDVPTAGARHAGTPARPIKVMHVLFSLRTGGTELGVVKLVNSLDGARVTSAICSSKPADALKGRLAPGVTLFEFNRRDGNDPSFVAQLVRLFRQERPDVVHTHSWGTLYEGLVAARLASVPHVIHGEHGTLDTRRFNLLAQRWAWRRADCVLSVSSRLAERMASEVGYERDRIHVIRNGIDTARFHPGRRAAARRALGFGDGDAVIGTVGRLVPVKDQATLLDALGQLRATQRPFKAVIAGDGPLRGPLESRAAALGLSDCLTFLGERADVEDVLAAIDVFTLSSVSEGLSNTILEAMATGLPVVATRVGGADELVEDGRTGVLVAARDPEALAAQLGRLVGDARLRQSMGAAGRVRAEREFSLERMTADYESMYFRIATGRTPVDRAAGEPVCAA